MYQIDKTAGLKRDLEIIKKHNLSSLSASFALIKHSQPDLQAKIIDYIPELISEMISSGVVPHDDIGPTSLVQKHFAKVYMIPELENVPYHPDLLALSGVTFSQDKQY